MQKSYKQKKTNLFNFLKVLHMEKSSLSLNINMRIQNSLFLSNKFHNFSMPLLLNSFKYSTPVLPSDTNKKQFFTKFEQKPNFFLSSGVVEKNSKSKKIKHNNNDQTKDFNGTKMSVKWYSEKLKNCVFYSGFKEGKGIHGKLIKHGLKPDLHLFVSLISFYAKSGFLDSSRKVLDEMTYRDVVSWTSLISGYVSKGRGFESVLLFKEMLKDGIFANEFTLATVLNGVSMCYELNVGKQVHGIVVKSGVLSDVYIGSALVDVYSKCGDLEYAKKVFLKLPEKNTVSWNALLNGYAESGDRKEIMRIVCEMIESDVELSKFNLSTVFKGLAKSGDLLAGEIVHCVAIKIGYEADEFVSSTLVDMYSKCGMANLALRVFKRIRSPDIVAWSSMISCFDQQGNKEEAVKLFRSMMDSDLRPNQFTLASLIGAATEFGPQICKSIHAYVYKYGFENENVVANALISMYMKIGSIRYGRLVFDETRKRDVVSWNALLSGFHSCDACHQGPKYFSQMLVDGYRPNMYTFISMLRCCSSLSNIRFGKQLHACTIKESMDDDKFVGTSVLDMYAKCGKLEYAEIAFRRLKEKDLFTWTVVISCCAQNDEGEKAIQYFTKMEKEGIRPNEYTLASCLKACAGISSLDNGQLLHSRAIKSGHYSDVFVGSSIIDMYAKCGCIENAKAFFEALDFRDTVAWNTMICSLSQHGLGRESLESFNTMLDEGVLPDKITFLGILSACSHMCLIEEGKRFFTSMYGVFGIAPSVEHCACVVDILGRAGKFDEVETFIKDMKIEPDALIWETVLGACKIVGNLEYGRRAAEKLFELEPERDSSYILLSNIFAAKGRWVDVSKVRGLMSTNRVKKEPGCSWISVDSKNHVFLSQDGSHPKILEIYQKLEELGEKLNLVGYSPNINYVLHDTSDLEKRENLYHHSERLALAFALVSYSPRKTIRIFKNLRICGDCHDFMKLVSEVTNRDIVVRDIKRFHHFQHGSCSCRDYW